MEFGPDVIKIGLVVTRGIDTDPVRRVLVEALVALAKEPMPRSPLEESRPPKSWRLSSVSACPMGRATGWPDQASLLSGCTDRLKTPL